MNFFHRHQEKRKLSKVEKKKKEGKQIGFHCCSSVFQFSMTTEVEWRRRWKPDLQAEPWKSFTIDESAFLLKSHFSGHSYAVLITDFTSCWVEELGEDDIKKRSKVGSEITSALPSWVESGVACRSF